MALFFMQAVASKLCLPTGEWYRDENNITWTNYSLCFTKQTITVAVNFSNVDGNPLISVSTLSSVLTLCGQRSVTLAWNVACVRFAVNKCDLERYW